MKTTKELSYGRAVSFGVAAELGLIAIQYVLLGFYNIMNPGTSFSFSSEYMMSRGFYFFLIPGFIMFATAVFFILRKYAIPPVAVLFGFLLSAAVIEVIFYLTIAATYQGVFVYSILDKIVGTALGVIGYFAVGMPEEHSSDKSTYHNA